jgi:hypothetical protein
MSTTLFLGHGDPLFWATMKDGKADYDYHDNKKQGQHYPSHLTTGHGDPLFQQVQDQDHNRRTTTKKSIHIEFLDDHGMEKWAGGGYAMTPEESAVRAEFYEQYGDPLTKDVKRALDNDDMEEWAAGYAMLPSEDLSDEEEEDGAVQAIRTEFQHGDPLMEDFKMEAWTARDDGMTPPQEAFHQVEGHHYSVESKRHGDPSWDATIKDPAWDKLKESYCKPRQG